MVGSSYSWFPVGRRELELLSSWVFDLDLVSCWVVDLELFTCWVDRGRAGFLLSGYLDLLYFFYFLVDRNRYGFLMGG